MIRSVLLVIASVSTSAFAAPQDDRLAAAYACLDKKLSDADRSEVPIPRLVSAALRACNIEVEDYLRNVERQAVLPSMTVGAPPPTAPSARPTGTRPADPKKAARARARKELIAKYEKRLAEERAKHKR